MIKLVNKGWERCAEHRVDCSVLCLDMEQLLRMHNSEAGPTMRHIKRGMPMCMHVYMHMYMHKQRPSLRFAEISTFVPTVGRGFGAIVIANAHEAR
jgi:hypothetical protein